MAGKNNKIRCQKWNTVVDLKKKTQFYVGGVNWTQRKKKGERTKEC